MNIDFLSKDDYYKTLWSGGSTTQVTIFPSEASVVEQNFIYRISSASVECDSNFTKYPNFTRYIMTLDNRIEIFHNNDCVKLERYDIHRFDGALNTTSKGVCNDFNFIVSEVFESEMNLLVDGEYCMENYSHYIFYALEDSVVEVNSAMVDLKKHCAIIIKDVEILNVKLFSSAMVVACMVKLN